MRPGTRVRFNGRCPWPERVGAEGVVVDPAIFEGRYPADKRMNWNRAVIVLLDDDPIPAIPAYKDGRWSCVTNVSTLDVLSAVRSPAADEDSERGVKP